MSHTLHIPIADVIWPKWFSCDRVSLCVTLVKKSQKFCKKPLLMFVLVSIVTYHIDLVRIVTNDQFSKLKNNLKFCNCFRTFLFTFFVADDFSPCKNAASKAVQTPLANKLLLQVVCINIYIK